MKKVSFKGFTLIEVMITVVIIGILAAIAYPSYTSFIAKSGRSEGVAAVMRVSNLQEQYYMDNRIFTEDMTKLGMSSEPFLTENGYYSVDSVGTTTYTITATAKGRQATLDTTCATITLTAAGVKGPSKECWK
ncbi:type IV pilin protein [Shewanella livingstonensis]|jgi:type IV pilus assembly protein PilE|uniref:Prepilin-type N-terminal cleavage/methylation domain-containing protein n=1 Tax=Shewanella livingstonensis TaxID=150120 RepID=A0A3G8LYQ3_9GAMM|nr:type IV pilin protein [Shewanella livingstonensis]AZG74225.1 prepilin-type N-terminal cleavage/methylation domain-containing protein [Shewanella livingstonensis]